MAEGTPGSEVVQNVSHGAEADIPYSLWRRPLFSEVTAAVFFPSPKKPLPCAFNVPQRKERPSSVSCGIAEGAGPDVSGSEENWGCGG